MKQTHAPKGTFDVLPYGAPETWQLSALWEFLEKTAAETARDFGYRRISTPIYEMTELFDRGVGETTDIVSKEMFTFEDRGGRSVSLRPEGTASAARAFIEHHLDQQGPIHKFYYIGPMFRYERPQSGRYRQHHQFGIEAFGASAPEQDAEIIELLVEFYRRIGLKGLNVHLNSVGDIPSRLAYREALQNYFRPFLSELSKDSQVRFEKNPLRILDSKDSKDKEIITRAPSILNHLSHDSKTHFEQVCSLLDRINVPYKVDDRIVRGLDYYHNTVFEVLAGNLGAQNTVGAGGRYDGLIKQLGGQDLPGIGFATGLERVAQVFLNQGNSVPNGPQPLVYLIPLGDEARSEVFSLATDCRRAKISVDYERVSKKVSGAIQNAVRAKAHYVCIIGSDELKSGTAQLKNLETREERPIALANMVPALLQLLQ